MIEHRPVLTELTYSLETGGSERIAAAIARHFSKRGVPTTVCATHGSEGAVGDQLRREGVLGVPVSRGRGGRLGRAWRLYRHFRDAGTTILHAHHFNMLSIGFLPARLAGVERIVVTEHSDLLMRQQRAVRRRAARFGRLADAVSVVHQGIADYLTDEIGVERKKITVIANGVDTTEYAPSDGRHDRRRLGVPEDGLIIGTVGRLHPDKDPLNLVRAFSMLSAACRKGIWLVFVGDGPLREAVRQSVQEADLEERVVLLGERTDIASLLRTFDVFVLPSRSEGLPVALLEAMSSGLPAVVTAVGGVPSAVGKAGLVVPPGNPGRLAEAVLRVTSDPDLRLQLGAAARERAVSLFDLDRMYEMYDVFLFPEGRQRDGRPLRESA